jgi:NitT/TauT family transport system substrate-binding protein
MMLAGAGAIGVSAPRIARTATPIKLTLPWLPLGIFSFAFAAKAMGFWERRGLDVTIDRGFGSGRVCVPVDQGQYDFGIIDLAVMMNCVGRRLDLVDVAGIWPVSPVGIFSLRVGNLELRRCYRTLSRLFALSTKSFFRYQGTLVCY